MDDYRTVMALLTSSVTPLCFLFFYFTDFGKIAYRDVFLFFSFSFSFSFSFDSFFSLSFPVAFSLGCPEVYFKEHPAEILRKHLNQYDTGSFACRLYQLSLIPKTELSRKM